jgi:hypothetical protein
VAGVASFDDLSIDTAAAGYQLRAAAGTLPQATSAIFDITSGGGTDGGPDGGGADGGVPDAGRARDQQIASERHGLIGFSCASGGGEWLAALGLAALLQLRRCRGQRRAGHPAAPPLLALLAALLVPAGVRAEDLAPLLGVLRLDDRQPPPVSGEAAPRADAAALEERLRALIARRHPEVRVMDRSTFVVLAAAKGRDLAQCEGECAVETGRLLELDLVVTGALARFGSSLKLTLRLDRAGDDPRQLAVAQAGGADAAALEEALPAALDSLLLPLGGEVAALQASRLRDQPPPRLSLLALAVADPAGSSVGGEVLAAARLPLGEARLGGAIAAHPGLRAAWVFTPLSLGRLSLRLGPRLLLTPLPGETGLGFGAAAEVRYRAHVRLSLVGSLGVEVQRAQGESRTAALALLGAEVGLWL